MKRVLLSLLACLPAIALAGTREGDAQAGDAVAQVEGVPAGQVEAESFQTLTSVYLPPSPLLLRDSQRFLFARNFAWIEAQPAPFLPVFVAANPPMTRPVVMSDRPAIEKSVDLLPKFDYVHGEVGFLYGRSTDSSAREVKQGYILGEMGNDKTHLRIGASYSEVKGRSLLIIP